MGKLPRHLQRAFNHQLNEARVPPNAIVYGILCILLCVGLLGLLFCGIKIIWEAKRVYGPTDEKRKVRQTEYSFRELKFY